MYEPLLKIGNHHHASCGDPPIISDDPDTYIGYFENPFGEQWVFTYNRATKDAELRGGDTGWNHCFKVQDGAVADLILDKAELVWLMACWSAATGERIQ